MRAFGAHIGGGSFSTQRLRATARVSKFTVQRILETRTFDGRNGYVYTS